MQISNYLIKFITRVNYSLWPNLKLSRSESEVETARWISKPSRGLPWNLDHQNDSKHTPGFDRCKPLLAHKNCVWASGMCLLPFRDWSASFHLPFCERFLQWTIVLYFCRVFLEVCLLLWWKCLHSRTCPLPLSFLPSSSSCKALAYSCGHDLSSKKNWSCLPQANRQLEYGLPLIVLALQMIDAPILFRANFRPLQVETCLELK